MPDTGVTKTVDNTRALFEKIEALTKKQVLVGVPQMKTFRRQEGDFKPDFISNAALAYIHEFGSPAHNIPARPFLFPGIRKASKHIIALLKAGAKAAIAAGVPLPPAYGDPMGPAKSDAAAAKASADEAEKTLHAVGLAARNAVVRAITNPDPKFVPLKPATIRARLRRTGAGRRKLKTLGMIKAAAGWTGNQSNQALTEWAEAGNIRPLIDTGQLRASITYVIRDSN
jgi:hypothetical protein